MHRQLTMPLCFFVDGMLSLLVKPAEGLGIAQRLGLNHCLGPAGALVWAPDLRRWAAEAQLGIDDERARFLLERIERLARAASDRFIWMIVRMPDVVPLGAAA